jgi:hypothetical protein
VIERDPEPLRRLRADVPSAVETLVSRCLQKDPERRFAKTDELASELAALAGRSRSGSLAEVARVAVEAPSAVSAEVVPPRRPLSLAPAIYHVQTGKRVRRYDEARLAELIRRGKLTGAELARATTRAVAAALRRRRTATRSPVSIRAAAGQRVLNAGRASVLHHLRGDAPTGPPPFWLESGARCSPVLGSCPRPSRSCAQPSKAFRPRARDARGAARLAPRPRPPRRRLPWKAPAFAP